MTFSDPVPQFSKDELDKMLVDAQEHGRLLFEIERGVNASKEYLTKVCLSLLSRCRELFC